MEKTAFARYLRKEQTKAEEILWKKLRNRQLLDMKFRRQVPIGPYIVDFYCPAAKLIIELDGSIHALQKEADVIREEYLKRSGYTIIRFENHVLFETPDAVMESIVESLTCILSLEKGEEDL